MAIVKCPNCDKPVDTNIGTCFSCGTNVMPSGVRESQRNESNDTGGALVQVIAACVVVGLFYLLFSWLSDDEPTKEDLAKQANERAEDRRKGFHCLSGWDGSHTAVKSSIKEKMRDPSSFEHIETKITPIDEKGNHVLYMKYRAKNGFGGMNVATAKAVIDNSSCKATILSIE